MKIVHINPGTGNVRGASGEVLARHARANMRVFRHDLIGCGAPSTLTFCRYGKIEKGRGRYNFLMWLGDRKVEVEMPGLTIDRVRFIDLPDQNIWHFPRLYVDGSSWVWMYAVSNALDALGLAEAAEKYRDIRDTRKS